MKPTTPQEIVSCLKYDGYSLEEGIRYCMQIAHNAELNPWADPWDAPAYREAAGLMRQELLERIKPEAE